jgi:hypothetical protein
MENLTSADWLYIGLTMFVVGATAVRSRASTFVLGLVVAFVMITLFNFRSPFKASYFSSFAFEVFIVWTIYIAIVRAIFARWRSGTLRAEPGTPEHERENR